MDEDRVKCPCKNCRNIPFLDVDEVKLHLYKAGFVKNYKCWDRHGETLLDNTLSDVDDTYTTLHEQSGCMIYWIGDKDLDMCKSFNLDRFKPRSRSASTRSRKPWKRMHFFPLTPRLKRLYASHATAGSMCWHATNHGHDFGVMYHPSDSEAWKHFDNTYPSFASETGNVILAVVPGLAKPKHRLDVFLQSVIAELKQLWEDGVLTYDVSLKQNFQLRVALMWTSSDFSAYTMLSGWSTAGKLACPHCGKHTQAFRLDNVNKMSWFDCHRRFLTADHTYRKDKYKFWKESCRH
ncbi:hypothetical protein LXL04_016162 [Taraxacum kok-saghyz]